MTGMTTATITVGPSREDASWIAARVRAADGTRVGAADGTRVGAADGTRVGAADGTRVGAADGMRVGAADGMRVGAADGMRVGDARTTRVGDARTTRVGDAEAMRVGDAEAMRVGDADGPLVAVVDPTGRLACWVQTLSDLLRIRLTLAPDGVALGTALESHTPIAVLCGDLGPDGRRDARPIAELIRLVSCYDRTMPLLLMTDDDPETLGSIDAASKLWPIDNLQRVAGDVHPETVLAFLARIGRRAGASRLMAV